MSCSGWALDTGLDGCTACCCCCSGVVESESEAEFEAGGVVPVGVGVGVSAVAWVVEVGVEVGEVEGVEGEWSGLDPAVAEAVAAEATA